MPDYVPEVGHYVTTTYQGKLIAGRVHSLTHEIVKKDDEEVIGKIIWVYVHYIGDNGEPINIAVKPSNVKRIV